MRKRTMATMVATLVAFVVCDGAREYAVRMRNVGSHDVDNARVSYGQFTFRGGILIPTGDHEQIDVREPLPRTAIVEWTDADGGEHREVVNVSFPHGFKGVLVFEIDETNRVRVLTESPPRHITP